MLLPQKTCMRGCTLSQSARKGQEERKITDDGPRFGYTYINRIHESTVQLVRRLISPFTDKCATQHRFGQSDD